MVWVTLYAEVFRLFLFFKEKRFCCCSHGVCFQAKQSFRVPCFWGSKLTIALFAGGVQPAAERAEKTLRRNVTGTVQTWEGSSPGYSLLCLGKWPGWGWRGRVGVGGAKKGIKERGRKVLGKGGAKMRMMIILPTFQYSAHLFLI